MQEQLAVNGCLSQHGMPVSQHNELQWTDCLVPFGQRLSCIYPPCHPSLPAKTAVQGSLAHLFACVPSRARISLDTIPESVACSVKQLPCSAAQDQPLRYLCFCACASCVFSFCSSSHPSFFPCALTCCAAFDCDYLRHCCCCCLCSGCCMTLK